MPKYSVTVTVTTEAEDDDYEAAIEEWRAEVPDTCYLGDDLYEFDLGYIEPVDD